ncbi:Uncharacterised protein [uncultured Flavonifractor sp.]|nr:Uncharacterised protein [uncultured Flavonifractor sp.]
MVMRSSQLTMPDRDSRNTDTPNTTTPTMVVDSHRGSFRLDSRAAPQASSMFIKEVIPAKNTDTKNSRAKSCPPGISWNTLGRVTNMREGPEAGSMPKANTAGMMAKPASRAAMVSSRAVTTEWWIMSSDFFM